MIILSKERLLKGNRMKSKTTLWCLVAQIALLGTGLSLWAGSAHAGAEDIYYAVKARDLKKNNRLLGTLSTHLAGMRIDGCTFKTAYLAPKKYPPVVDWFVIGISRAAVVIQENDSARSTWTSYVTADPDTVYLRTEKPPRGLVLGEPPADPPFTVRFTVLEPEPGKRTRDGKVPYSPMEGNYLSVNVGTGFDVTDVKLEKRGKVVAQCGDGPFLQ
jgi:hypothetical protein